MKHTLQPIHRIRRWTSEWNELRGVQSMHHVYFLKSTTHPQLNSPAMSLAECVFQIHCMTFSKTSGVWFVICGLERSAQNPKKSIHCANYAAINIQVYCLEKFSTPMGFKYHAPLKIRCHKTELRFRFFFAIMHRIPHVPRLMSQ